MDITASPSLLILYPTMGLLVGLVLVTAKTVVGGEMSSREVLFACLLAADMALLIEVLKMTLPFTAE